MGEAGEKKYQARNIRERKEKAKQEQKAEYDLYECDVLITSKYGGNKGLSRPGTDERYAE